MSDRTIADLPPEALVAEVAVTAPATPESRLLAAGWTVAREPRGQGWPQWWLDPHGDGTYQTRGALVIAERDARVAAAARASQGAEVERLRADLAEQESITADVRAERDALRAEVERLTPLQLYDEKMAEDRLVALTESGRKLASLRAVADAARAYVFSPSVRRREDFGAEWTALTTALEASPPPGSTAAKREEAQRGETAATDMNPAACFFCGWPEEEHDKRTPTSKRGKRVAPGCSGFEAKVHIHHFVNDRCACGADDR